MTAMKVELLYVEGCPNYEPLMRDLRGLLGSAGIEAEVELHRIGSEEEARLLRFLGSPTVRVDGQDVEPGADTRQDYGIKCRLYQTPDGVEWVPANTWILAAVWRADRLGGGDS
jgi:hypothetical protein